MTAATTSVHQALHGYRSGHRLLAGSTDLNPEDRRALSIVTDAPAVDADSGAWSTALSGWPLPSGKWYALSLTWAAGDGRRRGALWAHSLLLPQHGNWDPATIDLLAAFAEPADYDDNLARFSAPVNVKSHPGAWSGDVGQLAELEWAAHDVPISPVVFASTDSPDTRHALALAMWRSLWPAQRRTWRFLETLSLDRGAVDERLPDLAITRAGSSIPSGARVVSGRLNVEPPRWASTLAENGLADTGRRTRFERFVGSDERLGRDDIASAADVWTCVLGGDPTSALLSLSKRFPAPDDGLEMKTKLADPGEDFGGLMFSGYPRLTQLLITADASFGHVQVLAVVCRAVCESPNEAWELIALAASAPAGPVRDAVLRTAGPIVEARDEWSRVPLGARSAAILTLPDLGGQPGIWRAPGGRRLWESVSGIIDQVSAESLLYAIIEANGDVSPDDVYSSWPESIELVVRLLGASGLQTDSKAAWAKSLPDGAAGNLLQALDPLSEDAEEVAAALPESAYSTLSTSELKAVWESYRDSVPVSVSVFRAAVAKRDSGSRDLAVSIYGYLYDRAVRSPGLPAFSRLLTDVALTAPSRRLAREMNVALRRTRSSPRGVDRLDSEAFKALIEADDDAGLAQALVASFVVTDVVKRELVAQVISEKIPRDGLFSLLKGLIGR